ncbi:MAG: tRNA dihydrouridine(20/20a) synthase DusA [Holophagales bacterium]|nr:tRNA dihydrouridine(20/20a) synthase DusA [Holophagales bacterium]
MGVPSPCGQVDRRGRTRVLSVAPMMDRTDRHFRFLMRSISRQVLLYTEMVTTGAILHGDRARILFFDPRERPLALQLGGDDPKALARCALIAEELGYDEVNLNVGCPSDRVQKGRFGACLMAEPERVAESVAAMRAVVGLPVTVKHRIGIDELDRYEDMLRFVDTVAAAGADRFSVHARKAWLQGLSPKQNREIPPLRYHDVYRLKAERPELVVEINGGVLDLDDAEGHLSRVDAVMIGRAAYDRPYLFAEADRRFFDPRAAVPSRAEVLDRVLPYVDRELARGTPLGHLTRHLLNFLAGQPGARAWRRHLSTHSHLPGAGRQVIESARDQIPPESLRSVPGISAKKATAIASR